MNRIITRLLCGALLPALLLAGCGAERVKYSFTDLEVSHAMGLTKGAVDELAKEYSCSPGGLTYVFTLPQSTTAFSDNVSFIIDNNRVKGIIMVNTMDGIERSEHTMCGVHIGDKRPAAEIAAESWFGETGRSSTETISDSLPMFGQMYDMVTYGSEDSDKGELTITYMKESDSVFSVNFIKK